MASWTALLYFIPNPSGYKIGFNFALLLKLAH